MEGGPNLNTRMRPQQTDALPKCFSSLTHCFGRFAVEQPCGSGGGGGEATRERPGPPGRRCYQVRPGTYTLVLSATSSVVDQNTLNLDPDPEV